MKSFFRALACGALLPLFTIAAAAQESDVKKYTVDVRLEPAARAATVRTTLTVLNPTDAPKRRLQMRVNDVSEVRSVTFNGQSVQFTTEADKSFEGLQVITVQLPSPIPGRSTGDVVVETRLTVKAARADIAIAPGQTTLLPSSLWIPFVNTPFIQYGANTAPFSVTVSGGEGERVVSGGTQQGSTFTQPLYGLPFVITGAFDANVFKADAGGIALEVWLPEGAGPEARAGAERLAGEARRIAGFYTAKLGPAPPSTVFRIVPSDAAAGFASSSGVVFGRRVFSRDVTDAETFELLADALARVWVDGPFAVRGATPGSDANRSRGVAIVRDALPRYLAILALGERYGAAGERQSFERAARALAQMGALRGQVQLSLATPFFGGYRGLVTTKGPLALRLVEREAGRDAMLAAIREALSAARASGSLTADALRAQIAKTSGRDLAKVYGTWLDTVIEPDLVIGLPQQVPGGWKSALRNLGTGDVTVDVVATTESGKKVISRATIPSEDFGEVRFETAERVVGVEIDPDHLVPQTDYSNDVQPRRPSPIALFTQAVADVQQKRFAEAETALRTLVAVEPTDAIAKAWLGRALLGLGRAAEAEKSAAEAIAAEPVPAAALSWGRVVLGQAALASGRPKDAVEQFRRATLVAVDTPALAAARSGLIAAERAAGGPPTVDESARKFFAEFDRAISAGVNTEQAGQFVDTVALPDFVRGLVTTLSRKWSTDVQRTEVTGRDELLADVAFTVTSSGQSEGSTALVRLRRAGASWRIVDIQLLGGS